MADEQFIAGALNALLEGIDKGMERRRKAKLDEKELAIKEQEMKERHEDRRLSREQNDLYKTLLLKQTGERDAATIAVKREDIARHGEELKLKKQEAAKKSEDDESELMLKAGEQVRKYGEEEIKLTKKLGMLESDLQESPDDPTIKSNYLATKTSLEEVKASKIPAETIHTHGKAGAKVAPFMVRLNTMTDRNEAKSMLQKLQASKFKKGSKELEILVDEYLARFGPEK